MKEEIIDLQDLIKFIEDLSLFIKQYYRIVWSVEKTQKVKVQKLYGQRLVG